MKGIFIFLYLFWSFNLFAQQVSDTAFVFPIQNPKYGPGKGSIIMVDAAHYNFHTLEGRYAPFGKVLQNDGYRLTSNTSPFTEKTLLECRILVIANALDSSNTGQWRLPNPSAFSPVEIVAVHEWVKSGGRLLLIADHMPFAGAAHSLGSAFGFEFVNCFAMDNRNRSLERFFKGNQTLFQNEITQGLDTVVSFTGSAFWIPKAAKPILKLKNYTLLSPDEAWQFEENTPALSGEGFCQGAYMDYGKGKIVVMGEAAMLTAQLVGQSRSPVGLNTLEASQNGQLLRNIIHWLDH
jgi:hypothetical protein